MLNPSQNATRGRSTRVPMLKRLFEGYITALLLRPAHCMCPCRCSDILNQFCSPSWVFFLVTALNDQSFRRILSDAAQPIPATLYKLV